MSTTDSLPSTKKKLSQKKPQKLMLRLGLVSLTFVMTATVIFLLAKHILQRQIEAGTRRHHLHLEWKNLDISPTKLELNVVTIRPDWEDPDLQKNQLLLAQFKVLRFEAFSFSGPQKITLEDGHIDLHLTSEKLEETFLIRRLFETAPHQDAKNASNIGRLVYINRTDLNIVFDARTKSEIHLKDLDLRFMDSRLLELNAKAGALQFGKCADNAYKCADKYADLKDLISKVFGATSLGSKRDDEEGRANDDEQLNQTPGPLQALAKKNLPPFHGFAKTQKLIDQVGSFFLSRTHETFQAHVQCIEFDFYGDNTPSSETQMRPMPGAFGGKSAHFGSPLFRFGPTSFILSRKDNRFLLSRFGETSDQKRAAGTCVDEEINPLKNINAVATIDQVQHRTYITVQGGPISLAKLGVKEGPFHLSDLKATSIEGKISLESASSPPTLVVENQLKLHDLSLSHEMLSELPLEHLELELAGTWRWFEEEKENHEHLSATGVKLSIGKISLQLDAELKWNPVGHYDLMAKGEFKPMACDDIRANIPENMIPHLKQTSWTGEFSAEAQFGFDSDKPRYLVLEHLFKNRCVMVNVPDAFAKERFRHPFKYLTYLPDGSEKLELSGPGSKFWVPLHDISPAMISAILTTEDSLFFRHGGFNHEAIREALIANLEEGLFVRGASTISMQVAKNIFLNRKKNISRKFEELVLTDYMEHTWSKKELLELYFNIIEYGPAIYGIRKAALYYFGVEPAQLSVLQCYFLASLLPSPIRFGEVKEKGELPASRLEFLRNLMRLSHKEKKLSDAMLEKGLKEKIVFSTHSNIEGF